MPLLGGQLAHLAAGVGQPALFLEPPKHRPILGANRMRTCVPGPIGEPAQRKPRAFPAGRVVTRGKSQLKRIAALPVVACNRLPISASPWPVGNTPAPYHSGGVLLARFCYAIRCPAHENRLTQRTCFLDAARAGRGW